MSVLGEYFYGLYQHKERIRDKYTSRNEHYLAEFNAICDRQQLPDEWRKALHRAIFFQRDLKSQKGVSRPMHLRADEESVPRFASPF